MFVPAVVDGGLYRGWLDWRRLTDRRADVPVLVAERALQTCEGRLRSCQITRLQCLIDGLEILGAISSLKYLSVLVRSALAKRRQGSHILLRRRKITGLQVLSQLCQVGSALLMVVVQLLVDRAAGQWFDILRSAQVYHCGWRRLRLA